MISVMISVFLNYCNQQLEIDMILLKKTIIEYFR